MKKRIQFTALLSFDIEVELTDEQIIVLDNEGKEYITDRDSEAGKILTEHSDFSNPNDWYFKSVDISDTKDVSFINDI